MIFFILFCVIVALVSLELLLNHNECARILKKIPGPTNGCFLFGSALLLLVSPVLLFKNAREWARIYDGIYSYWVYPIPAINVYNPHDAEVILSSKKYMEKSFVYKFLKPWLREGLLLSSGAKWQQRRKLLTPAFHFNILRHFCEILENNSLELVEKLHQNGEEFTIDVTPVISECTLNAICETAMGTKLSKEKSEKSKSYKDAIYNLGESLIERFTRIYLFPDFMFNLSSFGRKYHKQLKTVHGFTKSVIEDRKIAVEKNQRDIRDTFTSIDDEEVYAFTKKNKVAMLDLLLLAEKDGHIDEIGVQEEVDTFMFEGHDTTATGLGYFLMLLANNKSVQDKIIAEVESIIGITKRAITMQELMNMNYLDCCVKESLRLYPPVHFISRNIPEAMKLGEKEIPAGTLCHIHIYDLHRREDLFENALKYNPDRFLPENSVGRHPYAFIPFSAGLRNCIGQRFAMLEMKSVVTSILRHFELKAVTKQEDIEPKCDLVLRNNGPIYVKFVRRKY